MRERIYNAETGETSERDFTADELEAWQAEGLKTAWADLRFYRNKKLSETDWTVMADTPTNTAAWKTYRQALRDLPANTTDPFNFVWPTPPA